MSEVWKTIPGYEGCYQASNLGRIKSLIRKGVREERILSQKIKRSYYTVHLTHKNKNIYARVNRLVAFAFIPNSLNRPFVNHINGKKLDNRPENLEWVSESENTKHAFNSGLHTQKGSKNAAAKLTEKVVVEIKELLKFHTPKAVSIKLGISLHNIYAVKSGRNWKHIGGHQQ